MEEYHGLPQKAAIFNIVFYMPVPGVEDHPHVKQVYTYYEQNSQPVYVDCLSVRVSKSFAIAAMFGFHGKHIMTTPPETI